MRTTGKAGIAAWLLMAAAACTSPVAGRVDAGALADAGHDAGPADLAAGDLHDTVAIDDTLADLPDVVPDALDAGLDTSDAADSTYACDAWSAADVAPIAAAPCLPASALYSAVPLPANSTPVCLFDNTLTCDLPPPAPMPAGAGCAAQCPAPYPDHCGACPWLPTAPMIYPRTGLKGVWTGKEIIVFGGFISANFGGDMQLTGERWDPHGSQGWKLLNTPPDALSSGMAKPDFSFTWTGKVVLVNTRSNANPDPSKLAPFRYDPATDTWSPMSSVGMPPGLPSKDQWVAGRLHHAGAFYDPETDTWAPRPPVPPSLLPAGATKFYVTAEIGSGDDLYLFDCSPTSPSATWPGVPAGSSATLRLHVPTSTWTAVAPVGVQWATSRLVWGFPGGLLVWGLTDTAPDYAPPIGAIYWKATDTWEPMTSKGPQAWLGGVQHLWTGGLGAIGSTYDGVGVYPPSYYWWAWPILFSPTRNVWIYPPPWGGPHDRRGGVVVVASETELFMLGGTDGPPDVVVIHNDGVRLPLPATPTGG